jgi:hypothetical protein
MPVTQAPGAHAPDFALSVDGGSQVPERDRSGFRCHRSWAIREVTTNMGMHD